LLRALLVGVLLLLTLSGPASGATILVTETADEVVDDGDCSLREAVNAARNDAVVDACAAGTANDVIKVPPG
jgi:CSLREA domain-containing protein